MAAEGKTPVEIAVCEVHGLRYNAAAGGGCARCRRERGETTTAESAPARQATLGNQLAIAALLVALSGLAFFSAHRQLLASLGGGFFSAGSGFEDTAFELDDGEYAGYGAEEGDDELAWVVEMYRDPEVERRRAEDPTLDFMIQQLEDPDFRRQLADDPDALQEHLDAIDELLYSQGDWDDEPY